MCTYLLLLLLLCRVSARDSGKTPLEAVLGEIVVTAEKLNWLIKNGEEVLKPCKRGAGVMVSRRGGGGGGGVGGGGVAGGWPACAHVGVVVGLMSL